LPLVNAWLVGRLDRFVMTLPAASLRT
jgi:hypothetical protein